MRNIIIGAAAIAALAGSAALLAATNDNVIQRSVAVHYADLNTDSAQGAQALYVRLRHAAKTACGAAPGPDLDSRTDFNACRADALTAAVSQVGSRTLTALHRSNLSPLELARFDSVATVR